MQDKQEEQKEKQFRLELQRLIELGNKVAKLSGYSDDGNQNENHYLEKKQP